MTPPPRPPQIISTFSKPKVTPQASKSSTPSSASSKSVNNNKGQTKTINTAIFKPVNVQHLNSNGKNKSENKTAQELTKLLGPKRSTSASYVRVSARDIENEILSPTVLKYIRGGKDHRSVFEKVDTHSGGVTYLGSGSFSDIENCIGNYLSPKKSYRDYTILNSKYDCYPLKSLTRASVLEDYNYDGILSPKYYRTSSHKDYYHYDGILSPSRYRTSSRRSYHYDGILSPTYCITSSRRSHHYYDHHTKSAAELSLDEIRQVNDSLAKYGIPVFTHHEQHPNPYYPPRSVGDLVSACRTLMEDPRLATYNSGNQAVHHAWDAIQHYQPNTGISGYASPAVRAAASHLFTPEQPPYNPSQSVISRLFSGQQQQAPPPPVYPPAPPMYPPPPAAYPPPPPMYPPPPPAYPQQPSNNPSQSVISRLFGR